MDNKDAVAAMMAAWAKFLKRMSALQDRLGLLRRGAAERRDKKEMEKIRQEIR